MNIITLPRSVVEQALEAFTRGCPPDCKDGMTDSGGVYPWGEPALIQCPACRAFDALRAALGQPQVEQEPHYLADGARYKVTHLTDVGYCIHGLPKAMLGRWVAFVDATDNKHMVTHPQPPRQPLTDGEVDDLSRTMVKGKKSVNWLCRAIERAHKIGGEA